MKMRGVIAASEPHSAEAGVRMLQRGGNAVDAIVAAKFAATITELPLTSLGGGGVCLWGSADTGYQVLDFFGVVPGVGLDQPPRLDFSPITVDFGQTTQIFHIGKGAVAVPGELVGLLELHRRAGRLPLRDVLAPAVGWACDGFTVSPQIAMMAGIIAPIVGWSSSVSRLFYRDGRLVRGGERLANPALGDFLRALGNGDADRQTARFWTSLVDHFGAAHGGLLTTDDVAAYSPVLREPLAIPYGRYTVLTNPPPAAGGGLIGVGLRLADERRLGGEGFLSERHLLRLASLLATVSDFRQSGGYDDRLRHDPQSVRAMVADGSHPLLSMPVGGPAADNALGATTHISVIDGEGMAATMTTSNGEGCGHALPDLGIHLNNFLGEEDINPDGFHRLPPGTRLSTMMSPTLVLDGRVPRFALGSGGSNRIRSAILQALLNLLTYDQPLDAAIAAARLHVEGRRLWFERSGLADGAAAALSRHWPECTPFDTHSMFFGGVNAVARIDGGLLGVGDRRRGGVVRFAD
ncbi:MAG TPA: gamma-glutamyltransferase [Accumulibacter sp.]|nr:gamma-glutamyltransferase [Accumulibacter sp.]HNC18083.1 gamma-glutamyltransferase [Accumulibacter sp.]HNE13263.1 gamma-glutamyltransferase [Accumulibacter sp.]HNL14091.1 gamma-glutamyltransferase [Accumulibacter sp.]HNO57945.1 gamma-glutamyltransferase [Accumulibacter sp.]